MNRALIQVASANDHLEQLQLSETEVERWLSEWQVSQEQKGAYLKLLVDVYAQAGNLSVSHVIPQANIR